MNVTIAADLEPNKVGSLECQIFAVGRLLGEAGLRVGYAFTGELPDRVRDHFRLDAAPVVSGLRTLEEPAGWGAWVEAVRGQRPDILLLYFFPAHGRLARLIRGAAPKAKVVHSEQVSRGFVWRSPLRTLYVRARAAWSAGYVDRFLAISDFIARRLREVDYAPAAKVRTVYNGVDLSRFPPDSGAARSYVTAICHLRDVKGVQVLLRALELLKARGSEPECRIVGDGPLRGAYEAFARERGLSNVRFLGLRDDVPAVLAGAAVAVVPSVWPEAFSLAAAEAMAAGTPVVASRVGALPEVVEEGVTGELVPPDDPAALADAVARIWGDPARRKAMGLAGRRRAEHLFDLDKQAREIVRNLLD
jgi:glycosyltransferase involved in cell wall biosynthesis